MNLIEAIRAYGAVDYFAYELDDLRKSAIQRAPTWGGDWRGDAVACITNGDVYGLLPPGVLERFTDAVKNMRRKDGSENGKIRYFVERLG